MENDVVEIKGEDGSWLTVAFEEDQYPEPVVVSVNAGNKKATQTIYLNSEEIAQLSNAFRRFRQAA